MGNRDVDLPALILGAIEYGEQIHLALDAEDLHRRATELKAQKESENEEDAS